MYKGRRGVELPFACVGVQKRRQTDKHDRRTDKQTPRSLFCLPVSVHTCLLPCRKHACTQSHTLVFMHKQRKRAHTQSRTHPRIHAPTRAWTHASTHLRIHTSTHPHIFASIHPCIHAYTHPRIHASHTRNQHLHHHLAVGWWPAVLFTFTV